MNVSKQTIIRVAVAAIAVINGVLAMFGAPQDLLNIDETTAGMIYDALSAAFMVVMAVYTAWKNNSFTAPAITADKVMDLLKDGYQLTDAVKELTDGK